MSENETTAGSGQGESAGNPGAGGDGVSGLSGNRPLSAFLLRRLAEAADGFRGTPVYCRARFTANPNFNFELSVHKVAPTNTDPEFGVFGPFETPEGIGPNLKNTPIESISITLRDKRVLTVDPKLADALFWTVSAVEKFLVPYYASINSIGMANRVITNFNREGIAYLTHGPDTEPQLTQVSGAMDPVTGEPRTETFDIPSLTSPEVKGTGPAPGLGFVRAI